MPDRKPRGQDEEAADYERPPAARDRQHRLSAPNEIRKQRCDAHEQSQSGTTVLLTGAARLPTEKVRKSALLS
jgi:hypothetical protein